MTGLLMQIVEVRTRTASAKDEVPVISCLSFVAGSVRS